MASWYAVSSPLASILGAAIASCIPIPKSTTFITTCVTALMIFRPPGAPTVIIGFPSLKTSIGDMFTSGLFHPAIEFARPGLGLNHNIPSASITPVPRHPIIDPKLFTIVCVQDTMFLSLSITLRCVVLDFGEGSDIA